MDFNPCRTFPKEVEDFYCTLCRSPCSALSLLVGEHTNHPRIHLKEAVECIPTEIARDLCEYATCVQKHLTSIHAKKLKADKDLQCIDQELSDVSDAIARLEEKRSQLMESQTQLRILQEENEMDARRKTSALEQVATSAVKSIDEIVLLCSTCAPANPATSLVFAENELELRRLADGFAAELSKLRSAEFPEVAQRITQVRRILTRGIVDECALLNHILNHAEEGTASSTSEGPDDEKENWNVDEQRQEIETQFRSLGKSLESAITNRNTSLIKKLLRCVKSLRNDAKTRGLADVESAISGDARVAQAFILTRD